MVRRAGVKVIMRGVKISYKDSEMIMTQRGMITVKDLVSPVLSQPDFPDDLDFLLDEFSDPLDILLAKKAAE